MILSGRYVVERSLDSSRTVGAEERVAIQLGLAHEKRAIRVRKAASCTAKRPYASPKPLEGSHTRGFRSVTRAYTHIHALMSVHDPRREWTRPSIT